MLPRASTNCHRLCQRKSDFASEWKNQLLHSPAGSKTAYCRSTKHKLVVMAKAHATGEGSEALPP